MITQSQIVEAQLNNTCFNCKQEITHIYYTIIKYCMGITPGTFRNFLAKDTESGISKLCKVKFCEKCWVETSGMPFDSQN